MIERFRILIVCSSDAARSVTRRAAPGVSGEIPYVAELTDRLAQLGHDVELWTARGGDDLETESLVGGAVLRRFRREHDYLVPRVRPCGWVAGFVEAATDHLAKIASTGPVIVSHQWEAGVAGRALSQAFELPHIHIADDITGDRLDGALPTNISEIASNGLSHRQFDEDRQTCREAAIVIATSDRQRATLIGAYGLPANDVVLVTQGPAMGERFAAAFPPPRIVGNTVPLAAAPISGMPAASRFRARRGPWDALTDSGVEVQRSV